MSSYVDWACIGYSCDPVPGSPEQVEEGAGTYQRTADDLSTGAEALRRMIESSDAFTMEAMDEIRSDATEVRSGMADIVGRYSTAATALHRYAPELRRAQEEARKAAMEAIEAQRRRNAYLAEIAAVRASIASFDIEQSARATEQASTMIGQANAANAELRAAHGRIAAAMAARDCAADEATRQIHEGVEASKSNDGWTDRVGEMLSEIADVAWDAVTGLATFIWDNIDTIALVLDIVAGALLVASVLFPGLAVAALGIKGIAALVTALKVARIGAAAIQGAKGLVGAGEAFRRGDIAGGVVAVATVAATTTLSFLKVKATAAVVKPSPGVTAAAQTLFRSHPIVMTNLVAQNVVEKAAARTLAIDGMKWIGGQAIELAAGVVRSDMSKRPRSEPCPAN